ncbi:MAG: DNA translocase FtsK 4TM domain-containing protein [Acidimicrobiia bacterium]
MATTRSRRAPSKSSASSKSGVRRPPAKGKRPGKPPARKAAAPGGSRVREAARTQLRGHGTDALALSVLVLGLLSGLALATDLTGPVGRALADGLTALLGNGAFLVPVSLVVVAVLLLWRRPEDEAPAAPLRVGIGVALVVLSAAGMMHVLGGAPSISGEVAVLRDAGGYVGALVGAPLAAGLGTVGAAIVLIAIGCFGMLLAPGTSLRRVLAATGHGLVLARGAVADTLELGAHDAAADEADGSDDALDPTVRRPLPSRRATVESIAADVDLDLEEDEPEPEPEPARAAVPEPDDEPVAAQLVIVPDDEVDELDEPTDIAVREADKGQMAIDLTAYGHGDWTLPPRDLLKRSTAKEMDSRVVEQGGEVLQSTLKDFGVDARLIGMTVGPTVTRYELELAPGVKVNRVTGLSHDIAYAMASPDVRILAPIPGRSAIGVEVPNKQRQLVTLGDILTSPEAAQATHPLEVGLGRDIAGRSHMLNLATMPHLLIAGQTGAGKSSCINSLITSILMRCTPEQVRMILVDPKRVELGQYNGLPHLLTEVVTNPKKAANALEWAVREMDLRYDLLSEVGVRDITGYNAMYDRGELPTAENPDPHGGRNYERLPFIIIVVDELNDLMMVAARDVEQSICRIAQMARAVGIHLVIATQRPSVDVITGVIKANVPSRLAFSVSTLADSRVILDQPGAEKLIGHGDMLVLAASSSRAQRIQGSWVDEECVRKAVGHWKRQVQAPHYVDGLQESSGGGGGGRGGAAGDDDDDDLLAEAMELVVRSGLGSTSMLQRKLRVGFARAGRLMDLLEQKGVVGPSEGSKARAVLMTIDEFEAMHVEA